MPDPAVLAERLVAVDGVVAVLLGGSRARGTHRPDSDVDLGVYYRPPLSVDGLGALARELGFADRAYALLARVGATDAELTATLDAAAALVAEVEQAVAR